MYFHSPLRPVYSTDGRGEFEKLKIPILGCLIWIKLQSKNFHILTHVLMHKEDTSHLFLALADVYIAVFQASENATFRN